MSCSSCGTGYKQKSSNITETLRNSSKFAGGVLALAEEQGGVFADRILDLAQGTIMTAMPALKGVCDFPDIECPPKIACTLIREVSRGERVVEPVLVRNIGDEDKVFVFQPADLTASDGDVAGPLVIVPKEVTLKPGQSALVRIAYNVTTKFQPGRRYSADVKVTGYYEQTIQVIAHVIDVPKCTVAQKDLPKDRRHYWQDHFYCEPPVKKEKPVANKTIYDTIKRAAANRIVAKKG